MIYLQIMRPPSGGFCPPLNYIRQGRAGLIVLVVVRSLSDTHALPFDPSRSSYRTRTHGSTHPTKDRLSLAHMRPPPRQFISSSVVDRSPTRRRGSSDICGSGGTLFETAAADNGKATLSEQAGGCCCC